MLDKRISVRDEPIQLLDEPIQLLDECTLVMDKAIPKGTGCLLGITKKTQTLQEASGTWTEHPMAPIATPTVEFPKRLQYSSSRGDGLGGE